MGKILPLIFMLSGLHMQTQGQMAVLSTEQTKALYQSVENEVSIAVPAYPCDDIGLESPNCTVLGEGCHYQLIPGDVPTAILIVRSKKGNKVLDTVRVPVRALPNSLSVKIASGKDNKGSILKSGPFLVSDDDAPVAELFSIVAFEVTLVRKDSILYQCRTSGKRFEPDTITAIEKTQAGDRLFLENIEVSGPDRRKRKMGYVVYTFR